MGLLVVGEIARLRNPATLAETPAGNRKVTGGLQMRQKGVVQLTTARIVVGLDIGPNSVGIRVIKVRNRGHRTGRVGNSIKAPVIKAPHRESELDLQVPDQGREISEGHIHHPPLAVGATKIRVRPREKAQAAPGVRAPPPRSGKANAAPSHAVAGKWAPRKVWPGGPVRRTAFCSVLHIGFDGPVTLGSRFAHVDGDSSVQFP